MKIGENIYSIASDDNYLERLRPGFDLNMVQLFNSLISKNDYVLDVGANIGCTSILFGQLSDRVFSFEPSPTTYAFLRRNIANSGLHNIKLSNCALGSESGVSEITFNPLDRTGAFVSNQTKAGAGHITEVISIERLDDCLYKLNIPRINFIKIDVEGFEKHVIAGAQISLNRFKPIVVLELNHWCLNAFQRTSIPDFFDYLRGIFPVLLAVEGNTYADLHNVSDAYGVMYNHLIYSKYHDIVAAFNEDQLSRFYKYYWRLSCNFLSNSFGLSMHTQVGKPMGTALQTSGRAGALLFGPYLSVDPGAYTFHAMGRGDGKGLVGAKVDVAISSGSEVLAEGSIAALASIDAGTWEIRLPFSVAVYYSDLELRIFVTEQSDFTVECIEILQ